MSSIWKAWMMVGVAACSLESAPDAETSSVEQEAKSKTVIKVNGQSAFVFLVDDEGTNGFVTVSEDQIAHTAALDFSYATPDPNNEGFFIIFQGAGPIPLSSYVQTATTAHLNLTTPPAYEVIRCDLNGNTGDFFCAPTGTPLVFNMTWTKNSLGSSYSKGKTIDIMGPITTKSKGESLSVTAFVNGTWGGRSSPDMTGQLIDTENTTTIREIMVAANP